MNKNIYEQCLSNCPKIDLGTIQLKYLGNPDIPNLFTIYELTKPLKYCKGHLDQIYKEIEKDSNQNDIVIKGLFILGVASIETLINDLLRLFLTLYPQKISTIKEKQQTIKETKNFNISLSEVFNGNFAKKTIEKILMKLSYGKLTDIIELFEKTLGIELEISEEIGFINEIKETRNLLMHNNLIINLIYLTKSGKYASGKINDTLILDRTYAKESTQRLIKLLNNIEEKILLKYKSKTLISLFHKLWKFTFEDHILFEDHFTIDIENDIFNGPFKESKYQLSSSELLLLSIWKSQRISSKTIELNLTSLDHKNSQKLIFLIDVFSHLKLTL